MEICLECWLFDNKEGFSPRPAWNAQARYFIVQQGRKLSGGLSEAEVYFSFDFCALFSPGDLENILFFNVSTLVPPLLKIATMFQAIPLLGQRVQESRACLLRSALMGAALMLSSPQDAGMAATLKTGAIPKRSVFLANLGAALEAKRPQV